MSKGLTPKQQAVLDFIRSEQARCGIPPTLREVGDYFGLRSTGSVRDHLRALERKGYIERRSHLSRGIVLRPDPRVSPSRPPKPKGKPFVPVLGEIAAGAPQLALENYEDILPVDPALFSSSELFALRVEGDSMINAGIYADDYVFVRPQNYAGNGEVVVALLDEEATLKRYFHEGYRVRLQPENDAMEPIYLKPRDVALFLIGKVVGLLRKL